MADEALKVGDVVYLNSGGPGATGMAVQAVHQQKKTYTCVWFSGVERQQGEFAYFAVTTSVPGQRAEIKQGADYTRAKVKTDADPFEPGDVVHLTCGGPSMTVVGVDGNGAIHCVWFGDGGTIPQTGPFAKGTLVRGMSSPNVRSMVSQPR